MATYSMHYGSTQRFGDEYTDSSRATSSTYEFEAGNDGEAKEKAAGVWKEISTHAQHPYFYSLERKLEWKP